MTAAQWFGLVLIAAELALVATVAGGLLLAVRRTRRDEDAFWRDLAATVEAARADIDRDALAVLHGLDTYSAAAAVLAPELIAETEAHLEDVAR